MESSGKSTDWVDAILEAEREQRKGCKWPKNPCTCDRIGLPMHVTLKDNQEEAEESCGPSSDTNRAIRP